jgi:hypothetical protein
VTLIKTGEAGASDSGYNRIRATQGDSHQMRAFSLVLLLCLLSTLAWSQGNIVACNSDDMNYHTCNIGPNRGVTLIRQHSDARCIEGQTYGVRGEQLWVNRGCRAEFQVNTRGGGGGWDRGSNVNGLTCNSDDMHRHYCALPFRGRVQMVHQHSDAQCIEGQTWGVRGNQLWVDRGCRADFEISQEGHGHHHGHDWDGDHGRDDHHDDDYGSVRTVTCSSDDMHRHTCDVGPNNGIRLARKRSDARCDFNRTYGFSGNQIWVDRGCRADFEVTPPNHRPHRP